MIKSFNFCFFFHFIVFVYISLYFIISSYSYILITESVRCLEIKTSILFNLYFAENAILSCFFFSFLIIDLYFLIPAVIAQIFNPISEFVIPIEIRTKEAKAEIEIYPVIVEAKIVFNII